MSLYQNSQDDLSAILSAAAGMTIASGDYTVAAVRATVAGDNTTFNTKAAISALGSGNYTGNTTVFYNRLDLGALTNFSPYLQTAAPGVSVYTLLTTLLNQYGIRFTTDDLVDHSTTDNGDGTVSLVLEAKSTSLGWINSVTVKFASSPGLSSLFISTTLPSF